jgi:Zn-finger nucleic acid-binding protein
MECPACRGGLVEITSRQVVLDVCREGCGGIWFDRLELKQLDEPHEEVEALLLEIHAAGERAVDHEARRDCPRCDAVVLMRRFASGKREVAVDECPGCGGFWLDGGELPRIRSEYRTEAERKQAALKLAFGPDADPVGGLAAESAASVDRHEKLTWILNLLCRPGRRRF